LEFDQKKKNSYWFVKWIGTCLKLNLKLPTWTDHHASNISPISKWNSVCDSPSSKKECFKSQLMFHFSKKKQKNSPKSSNKKKKKRIEVKPNQFTLTTQYINNSLLFWNHIPIIEKNGRNAERSHSFGRIRNSYSVMLVLCQFGILHPSNCFAVGQLSWSHLILCCCQKIQTAKQHRC